DEGERTHQRLHCKTLPKPRRQRFPSPACGRGCPSGARAGEGLLHLASALSRLALRARHPLPLRGRGKEQRAAPRQPSPSIRPRITPAVHQQILPGDESRMRRAEKREVSPELLRPPITLRRIARRALAPDLVERLAAV